MLKCYEFKKNVTFLKGIATPKVKPQFERKFVESQAKEKSFKLALIKGKIKDFEIYYKENC